MHCKLRLVDRDMSKNNCNTLCAHMASSKPIWGDSVCPINPLTEGYEEKYFKSLSKKSKDVFRSNQIYYALMRTGDLHAKLSEPKPLLTLGLGALAPKAIRWPLGTQVLQEKMKHTSPPPQKKEPLYISSLASDWLVVKGLNWTELISYLGSRSLRCQERSTQQPSLHTVASSEAVFNHVSLQNFGNEVDHYDFRWVTLLFSHISLALQRTRGSMSQRTEVNAPASP
ncbi:unnamed protein product [Calicophoron daubneyi]|uniref:Uncharacterized protein n=1 Tax=Calicophoron daubneyi TaxID=300641 RepID=A0AAV2THP2_CALDB